MQIHELISEQYTLEELTISELFEAAEHWNITNTSAFKKGYKKHRNDKRAMSAFDALMQFIKSHDKVPAVSSYPIEHNVHILARTRRGFEGVLTAHIKGQQVALLFNVTPGNINLIHFGSHKAIGRLIQT